MAALLYHIDEIARVRKSDVLWLAFEYPSPGSLDKMPRRLRQHRSKIMSWMKQRKLEYEPCFGTFDGALEEPYRGDFFIDTPINPNNQDLSDLEEMLELPDGSPKISGVVLYLLPLTVARKNGRFYRKSMREI